MFRGFRPTTEINTSYTLGETESRNARVLAFTGIRAKITAQIYGVDDVSPIEAYITSVTLTSKNTQTKGVPDVPMLVVYSSATFDVRNIMLTTFNFVHIFPAESIGGCADSVDADLVIRITSEKESDTFGLGSDVLLGIPQTGAKYQLSPLVITSFFCIPEDLAELGGIDKSRTLVRASGATAYAQPYL